MHLWLIRLLLILVCVLALPFNSPAPLIYRPGEGWTYEPVGGDTKWRKERAVDQLGVAKAAFDAKQYDMALKAARHLVSKWPTSDYGPEAQYIIARCYDLKETRQKAFNEYQKLLEKYPKTLHYDEALQRQYDIVTAFYNGEWLRLWNYIPIPPFLSAQNDKMIEMYQKVVKNGTYSDIAPQAQLKIGSVRERQSEYPDAVRSYMVAVDRYYDRPIIAADALYRAAQAWQQQAKSSEYDQGAASSAINSYSDFIALYPEDSRVTEAEKTITMLRSEQARGSYLNARFYEKKRRWAGALVYYGDVILKDPNSPYAPEARLRIEALNRLVVPPTAAQ